MHKSPVMLAVLIVGGCSLSRPGSDPGTADTDQTSARERPTGDGGQSSAASRSLSGTVRLASGRPVAGASVKLDETVVQTDADGRFHFADVPAGSHALSTTWGTAPCIASAARSVDVSADDTVDLQLGGPEAIVRKTLVINYDPIIEEHDNKRLHQVKGWQDPKELNQQYVDTLAQCSHGLVEYDVVEWVDADDFPLKADGFRYTDATFLAEQWHQPDNVNYAAVVSDYDLVNKVNAGAVDEVITWGGPYFGFWESHMIGPTAYFVNSGGYVRTDLQRNFVVMGLNYERGLAEAIHAYGHRLESIMRRVYGRWEPSAANANAWELFTARESDRPGSSGCGNVHFPPNGTADYDYGNDAEVASRCEDYSSWPNLTGATTAVGYTKTWKATGNAQLDYLRYWFAHVPHSVGVNADTKQNNWWKYAADFNAWAESR